MPGLSLREKGTYGPSGFTPVFSHCLAFLIEIDQTSGTPAVDSLGAFTMNLILELFSSAYTEINRTVVCETITSYFGKIRLSFFHLLLK